MSKKTKEVSDRLEFLAKQFDMFDCSEETLKNKLEQLKKDGYRDSKVIKTVTNKILAIVSKHKEQEIIHKPELEYKISICIDVFTDMVEADPTEHKMFLQWMLNVFNRLLKGQKVIQGIDTNNGSYMQESIIDTTDQAIRFASEDLPQAKQYLTLFEANKRKKNFKNLCSKNHSLKDVIDYSDINQYKSLSQLFDAVDPFIERNPTELESLLEKFVSLGDAEIPVRDRKFTVYIPKTRDASVAFDNFSNWCTAKAENSNFQNYTENYKKPNGKNSTLYIIINNNFFKGTSDEIYQIHFETDQIKSKENGENISIYEPIIKQSEALSNYFYNELIIMAKECRKGIENNRYLDYLLSFGFADSIFEIFDEMTPAICVFNETKKREIPNLPDMSKFVNLDNLVIVSAKLNEINPSIGKLKNLNVLSIPNNNLTFLPKEIGNLKRLTFINICGNKLKDIPDEMGLLDKDNGGALNMMSVSKSTLGDKNYNKLKKLLPNVKFNDFDY